MKRLRNIDKGFTMDLEWEGYSVVTDMRYMNNLVVYLPVSISNE